MPRPNLSRLFRVSLRGLLVAVTVLCVLLAFKVRQVERQKAAVRWVKEHGGFVGYDFEWEYEEINRRPPPPSLKPFAPSWAIQLLGIDYFASAVFVGIEDANDLNDLSPLTNLPELMGLHISSQSPIDLSPLSNSENLRFVWLDCSEIDDFSPLLGLENLEEVVFPASATEDDMIMIHRAISECRLSQMSGAKSGCAHSRHYWKSDGRIHDHVESSSSDRR